MEEEYHSNVDDMNILTHNDCIEIVHNDLAHKDFVLKSYKIVKGSTDLVGFMGEYYKLKVDVEERTCHSVRTLNYFVKCVPLTNAVYRDECERKGFFRKESSIYRDILPHIQRYANTPLYPKSYLARTDVIVLEDLSQAGSHLRQLNEDEEYSMKHYQLFLQHLAKLHAASLAWELKEGVNIGEQFKDVLFEMQLTTNNEWYTTGVKGVVYLALKHPKYQYAEAQEFIQQKLLNIFLSMEDFANPSATMRNVLCHRDSWDRNIFWEYNTNTNSNSEPIACRIVDFQLMRYSPPAIDVLNFLYNNFTDAQQKDEQLSGLLNYYYDTLQKELKRLQLSEDLIPKSEFDEDCRRALLPVITLKAICCPLLKLPKGWAATMRATQPEQFDGYMNNDRSEMFERVAQIHPEYREMIEAPVQEIMEHFGFEGK